MVAHHDSQEVYISDDLLPRASNGQLSKRVALKSVGFEPHGITLTACDLGNHMKQNCKGDLAASEDDLGTGLRWHTGDDVLVAGVRALMFQDIPQKRNIYDCTTYLGRSIFHLSDPQ